MLTEYKVGDLVETTIPFLPESKKKVGIVIKEKYRKLDNAPFVDVFWNDGHITQTHLATIKHYEK